MGKYINPKDMSKEDFLLKHGLNVTPNDIHHFNNFNGRRLPVCLVNNGGFTAAAICDDARELEAFTFPDDHRPKRWFLVERTKLSDYL